MAGVLSRRRAPLGGLIMSLDAQPEFVAKHHQYREQMSPLKMQLVEAQRENPDWKEAWHGFCDAELGGNRDLARQEPDVLQAFVDQQGVSVDISSLANADDRTLEACARFRTRLQLELNEGCT